jgi:hypothetical protein
MKHGTHIKNNYPQRYVRNPIGRYVSIGFISCAFLILFVTVAIEVFWVHRIKPLPTPPAADVKEMSVENSMMRSSEKIDTLEEATVHPTPKYVESDSGTVSNSLSADQQPMATKIQVTDASENSYLQTLQVSAYDEVWTRLYRLANSQTTIADKKAYIDDFLSSLNYRAVADHGDIVSKADGTPINPDTLMCYLNGFIPDKPYLKANCPAY